MRLLLISLFAWILVGCGCDSTCKADRTINTSFDKNTSDEDIIYYLNQYKGKAPGAATYGAFVNWGVTNPKRFIAILNHPKITKRNLDLVVYKIADYGNHSKYCQIYKDLDVQKNDKYIRDRLLGCNYDL